MRRWTTMLSQGINVTVASVQKLVATDSSTLGYSIVRTEKKYPAEYELLHVEVRNDDGTVQKCVPVSQAVLKDHNLSQTDVVKVKIYHFVDQISRGTHKLPGGGRAITVRSILDDCELVDEHKALLFQLPGQRSFFPRVRDTYLDLLERTVDFCAKHATFCDAMYI